MDNPFRPSFGSNPPQVAGRAEVLESFDEALELGPGAPGRAMMFTGARGSGKTVMLNVVEDHARHAGWTVLSHTAAPGLAAQLRDTSIPEQLHELNPSSTNRVTGINLATPVVGGGITRESHDPYPVTPSLRSRLTELAKLTGQQGHGVLVSIDELNWEARDDLRELTQTIQHLFREEQPVMLAAGGIPLDVERLLSVPGMTFIRRAERYSMSHLEVLDVAAALHGPITTGGRAITQDALATATHATGGYAFMVQLVGYHSWRADPSAETITLDHVQYGVSKAAQRMGQMVHSAALLPLSDMDRRYLGAMALDEGPSRAADLRERLGVTSDYVGRYRDRLINAEVIRPAGYGEVEFALPYLRDYLRAGHDAQQLPAQSDRLARTRQLLGQFQQPHQQDPRDHPRPGRDIDGPSV